MPPPAAPIIPYTRFGPATVNPIATAAIIYNTTLNAGRPPPVNTNSASTITIGLTWSSTGSNALEPGLPTLLAFLVDLVNGRGGVWMDGVQHSINILLGDDQSSLSYMQLLYEDMLSQGVQVFVAPYGDDYVTPLLPLIHSANATFYNVEPSNPNVFANNTAGNLWAFAPTADFYLRTSLNLINSATQQLYNNTRSGMTSSGGYVSRYGLTTVCAYTADLALFNVQRMGLIDWISIENGVRSAAGAHGKDLVQLLVDETVPDFGEDGSVYKPYYDQCPDDVDALVLLVDGLGAIEGMAASQLRAKAVIGLSGNDGFNNHILSQVQTAAGVIQPVPVDVPYFTTIPGSHFANYNDLIGLFEMYTAIAYGVPTVPLISILGYAANIAQLMSALNLSRSIAPGDMRDGTLALNGYVAIGGLIEFNATTGVNTALIGEITQMMPDGIADLLASPSDFVFPYDWPWHRVLAGDTVQQQQTSSWSILGLVIGVLGVWVAQIITEQAIFARRRGGHYHVWLAVVALSLGGVGVWCNVLVQSTALTTKLPGATASQAISFSLGALLIAILPCLVLTFCGLLTAISDVEASNTAKRANRAAGISQALRAEKSAKKKAAALSNRQHLSYLIDCITWRAALGGLLLAAAVVLTRVTLWSIWVQDADYRSVAWGWAVTLLLDVLLIPTALLMFIHALRWRIAAVFIFSAAVMVDWQLMVASMHFEYAPSRSSFLDSVTISSEVIVLVAGLIAALIAFVFLGLLFRAMRLSRNDLSLIVVELETVVARQKTKALDDANRMQQCVKDVDVLARSLDAVNVLSSLPQDYGLALTMYTSAQQLWAGGAGERGKVGSVVTSLLSPAAATSQTKSVSVSGRESVSETASEMQVAPSSSLLPQTEQPRGSNRKSSVAVAPVTLVSPKAESSKQSDLQADKRSSQTHLSQVVLVTPADRELEIKLEDTLAALTQFRIDSCTEANAASDGSTAATSPGFITRARLMGSSSTTTTQLSGSRPAALDEFQLTAPLLGKQSADDGMVLAAPPAPSMETVMDHPVAVEVFKEELRKTQSVESLVFCLHVRRYRTVQSKKARRLLAGCLSDSFIRTSSSQQININSRQRDAILAVVDKKDAVCAVTLFDEAERECMLLMRTNVFKSFTTTSGYRLCAWLCHTLDVRGTTRSLMSDANGGQADGGMADLSWVNTRTSKSGSVQVNNISSKP